MVGSNHRPTPVELLLHAIAAGLTAGPANVAAAPEELASLVEHCHRRSADDYVVVNGTDVQLDRTPA